MITLAIEQRADAVTSQNLYDLTEPNYHLTRQADPSIAQQIWAELGAARNVVNVGAGTGSYEPADRQVTAVDPSAWMRRHRPAHLPPAVAAAAENLPFPDQAFDAGMALATIHHWTDLEAGLAELRRVTRGPIVILAFDPHRFPDYWLADYAPHFLDVTTRRCPSRERLRRALPGLTARQVDVPLNCTDGFAEAFYGRPEAFLDPAVRSNQSGWHELTTGTVDRAIDHLRHDLSSGTWDRHHGHLRRQPTRRGALTLLSTRS